MTAPARRGKQRGADIWLEVDPLCPRGGEVTNLLERADHGHNKHVRAPPIPGCHTFEVQTSEQNVMRRMPWLGALIILDVAVVIAWHRA